MVDAAVRHTTEERVLNAPRFKCGLPIELWAEIIAYIAQPSVLAQLALACQTLRPEAERALYRNASVGPRNQSVLKFCETVVKCSRRAAAVKSLRIVFTSRSHSAGVVVRQALAKAFAAIVCVEDLDLRRTPELAILSDDPALNMHFPGSSRSLRDTRRPRLGAAGTLVEKLSGGLGWPRTASQDPPLLLEWPHIHTLACPGALFSNLALPRSQLTCLELREYYHHILTEVAALFGDTLVGLRLGAGIRPHRYPSVSWSPGEIATKFPRLRHLHLDEYLKVVGRDRRSPYKHVRGHSPPH